MAYATVLQNTTTWVAFVATDANTGDPRTGIIYTQVDVTYKKSNQITFTAKTLAATDFRENGLGVYEILFSAAELNTIGSFIFVVTRNLTLPSPGIRQFIGLADVQTHLATGTIFLNTNVLTGNLVDLSGVALVDVAVSARVLEAPEILGVYPNVGGIGTDIIGARTDSSGFFALEVLQNSLVDISIPRIGYRRTLRVPANTSDVLFNLP